MRSTFLGFPYVVVRRLYDVGRQFIEHATGIITLFCTTAARRGRPYGEPSPRAKRRDRDLSDWSLLRLEGAVPRRTTHALGVAIG